MKRYPKAKRLLGIVIEQGSLKRSRMISLFYARFAFADAFESVNVRDFGDKTVRGYSALIKLQLAYSAFETLLDVIDDYKSIVKISTKPYMHLIEKEH